jgi:hypothetical protein
MSICLAIRIKVDMWAYPAFNYAVLAPLYAPPEIDFLFLYKGKNLL